MILKIKLLFGYIIYAIHLYYYRTSEKRSIIDADIERWCDELELAKYSKIESLVFY